MSKSLSSDVTPVLELQGFNVMLRKAIPHAPVYLEISQKGSNEYHIDQTTTASIPAIKEEWYLDWEWREQKDAILGKVKSRSRWIKVSELENAAGFLTDGLKGDDQAVEAIVESLGNGWDARQIWRIEEGRFVRRVITSKDGKDVETNLVYEFDG